MIGVESAGNIEHWDQLIGRLLDLATRKDTLGIAVKQQRQHHLGGIGRTTTANGTPLLLHSYPTAQRFLQQSVQGCWA